MKKWIVANLVLLGACTGNIYPDAQAAADKACEINGGLKYFNQGTVLSGRRFIYVTCENGYEVSFQLEKK